MDGVFDSEAWRSSTPGAGKPRIAIVGFAGAGKSLMVNTLFGKKVASVNARAGWTRIPQFVEHEYCELIDTPGFGSDGWDQKLFLRQIIEPADLVVHLVNGASGLTDYDRELYDAINGHPGLVMVLNKVDLLDASELNEAMDGVAAVLARPAEDIVPVSAKTGLGIPRLVETMTALLPDTLKSEFVSSLSGEGFTKTRIEAAEAVVERYSRMAAFIGCVPVPVADVAALAPLQVTMFLHVSRVFGHDFTREQAKATVASLLGSVVARSIGQVLASAVKGIPGLGSFLGAAAGGTVAYASFKAFGGLVVEYFRKGQRIEPRDIRRFYDEQYARAKEAYRRRGGSGKRRPVS